MVKREQSSPDASSLVQTRANTKKDTRTSSHIVRPSVQEVWARAISPCGRHAGSRRCHRNMFQDFHVNCFRSSYRSRDTVKRGVLQAAHLLQKQVSTANSVPKSDAHITIQPEDTDETPTMASTTFEDSSWLALPSLGQTRLPRILASPKRKMH